MRPLHYRSAFVAIVIGASFVEARASVIINVTDVSGLSGQAEFTLVNPTTLQVRLKNTSTGVPSGFDNSDQLLTSCAFQLNGGVTITGGTAFTGPTSQSVNFDITNVGPNANVGGEWGYGNGGGTGFGSDINFISANTSGATAFGGPNLDGPAGLDGPQGGLVANPEVVPLGGLGAIRDEIIATLTLSSGISNLDFLSHGIIIEYGSDAAFLHGDVPAPGALALLGLAGLVGSRRRRR